MQTRTAPLPSCPLYWPKYKQFISILHLMVSALNWPRAVLKYAGKKSEQRKVKIQTQKNSDKSVMQFFVWFYFQVFVLLKWLWVGLSNEETKKTMLLISSFLIPDMSASAPWFFCSMCCEASDATETTWPDLYQKISIIFWNLWLLTKLPIRVLAKMTPGFCLLTIFNW